MSSCQQDYKKHFIPGFRVFLQCESFQNQLNFLSTLCKQTNISTSLLVCSFVQLTMIYEIQICIQHGNKNISKRTNNTCKQIEKTGNQNGFNLHFFQSTKKPNGCLRRPTHPPTLIVIATGRLVRSTLRRERERSGLGRIEFTTLGMLSAQLTCYARCLPCNFIPARLGSLRARLGSFWRLEVF